MFMNYHGLTSRVSCYHCFVNCSFALSCPVLLNMVFHVCTQYCFCHNHTLSTPVNVLSNCFMCLYRLFLKYGAKLHVFIQLIKIEKFL